MPIRLCNKAIQSFREQKSHFVLIYSKKYLERLHRNQCCVAEYIRQKNALSPSFVNCFLSFHLH